MTPVTIYTDGSCSLHDKGRGGYGAVLIYNGVIKEIYGGYMFTTNNRMELTAVIKSLQSLKRPCKVIVHSDSKYVTDAINKRWFVKWQNRKFFNVKNSDLWQQLLHLITIHDVEFKWVKGHSGVEFNERADELATIGAHSEHMVHDTRC